MMKAIFADLHIHIGQTETGLPVKISASPQMRFQQIVHEASKRKGLDLIGIVDAHSPPVQEEIRRGLTSGLYDEHEDGGIVYQATTCILGVEMEIKEAGMGPAHVLAFFPYLHQISRFTDWLQKYMKNIQLSTQRLYQPVQTLQEKVLELDGILIPAHVFTPFKSVYGSATDRMRKLFRFDSLAAVELGLSSDSSFADRLSELHPLTFVTNSDAHSLAKIGREYNQIAVKEASFQELRFALLRKEGRQILANYGFDPRLGKYYRTRCKKCNQFWSDENTICPNCGSDRAVKGVRERVLEIQDQPLLHPPHRPPYIHHVPLEFIPKLGKKTLDKLLQAFGTEMNILHSAPYQKIAEIANPFIAEAIQTVRENRMRVVEGGGGIYGQIEIQNNN